MVYMVAILCTGLTSDLCAGYSITKDIADAGGNVAVIDLRDTPLEDVFGLAKQYGVKAEYFQADVSNESQLTSAFEKVVQSFGTIDGIVTAAGIAIDKPFVDQKWEEVEKVLQVNVSLDSRGLLPAHTHTI